MHFLLYYIVPFGIVLGILIFFHELGHFLAAKFFGVRVLKFSLGFGPRVLGKKVGDTEYLLSLVPLGGYVKMLGEEEEDAPPLDQEMQRLSFGGKPPLQRMAIVFAGPLFNFVLALVTFCVFYALAGAQVMAPEVGQVREDSPAERAGLLKGDMVTHIQGEPVREWQEIKSHLMEHGEGPVDLRILREGKAMGVTVAPEISTSKNIFGEEIRVPTLGIVASGRMLDIALSPAEGVLEGLRKTWEITVMTCMTVVKLFQRIIPISTLGGPILIGQMTGQLAEQNVGYLIPFLAVISINLAVLNLLPIPILDGGMLLFLLIELLLGRPMNLRKRDIAQRIGLALLIVLMAVVIYNDVLRLVD